MGKLGRWTIPVLAAVVLALATSLNALLLKGADDEDGPPVARLWIVDMRSIDRVAIADPGTSRSGRWTLQDGVWVEDRPGGRPMPLETWSGVPLLLSRPEVVLVNDHPPSLAPFGLNEPRLLVEVQAAGKRLAVMIGDRLPDGSGYYLMLDGGRAVYAIDYSWFDVMKQTIEAWNDAG